MRAYRVALVVALHLGLPAAAQAGVLRGTIFFPQDARPAEARPLAYWRDENGFLPVTPAPAETRSDAIVVLEADPPKEPIPGEATIEARGLRLEPRTVIVALGSTIKLKNRDRVGHAFYLSDRETLPKKPTPPGEERTLKLSLPGEYRILDDPYPHATATVLVVRSSWFVRADDKGGFRIEAPDGRYSLRVWFRGGWSAPQRVEVGKGGEVVVRLAAPEEEAKK